MAPDTISEEAERAGWVLVPREPTPEMLAAGDITLVGWAGPGQFYVDNQWRAMLSAAPPAPSPDGAQPVAMRWRVKGYPDWTSYQPWSAEAAASLQNDPLVPHEVEPLYARPAPSPDGELTLKDTERAVEQYTRLLAKPDWRPSRAHIEGARNSLERAAAALRSLAAERDKWRERESETQEALQKIGEDFGVRAGEPRTAGIRRVLTELRTERNAYAAKNVELIEAESRLAAELSEYKRKEQERADRYARTEEAWAEWQAAKAKTDVKPDADISLSELKDRTIKRLAAELAEAREKIETLELAVAAARKIISERGNLAANEHALRIAAEARAERLERALEKIRTYADHVPSGNGGETIWSVAEGALTDTREGGEK